jgi:Ser/Thr protein kinase RdoA (MazF antagonist)
VKDIADGVFLFAGRRLAAIDPGDIVSLTQTWTPSPDRAQIFMEGYLGESTLTQEEMEALPLFVKARWLFCRVAGMSKVAPERRISYFLDGLLEPLRAIGERGCL